MASQIPGGCPRSGLRIAALYRFHSNLCCHAEVLRRREQHRTPVSLPITTSGFSSAQGFSIPPLTVSELKQVHRQPRLPPTGTTATTHSRLHEDCVSKHPKAAPVVLYEDNASYPIFT